MDRNDELFYIQKIVQNNASNTAMDNKPGIEEANVTFFNNNAKADGRELEYEPNRLDMSVGFNPEDQKLLNSSYHQSSRLKKSTGAFGFHEDDQNSMILHDSESFGGHDLAQAINNRASPKHLKAEIKAISNNVFDAYATDEMLAQDVHPSKVKLAHPVHMSHPKQKFYSISSDQYANIPPHLFEDGT